LLFVLEATVAYATLICTFYYYYYYTTTTVGHVERCSLFVQVYLSVTDVMQK